jgi:hypothetical protein
MTSPATAQLEEAGYPLPWKTEETWNGRAILAANDKRVVLINKGRAGTGISTEYMLATLIAGAVNQAYEAPA